MNSRILIVFNMAKVASRSWVKALRGSATDEQIYHFHSTSSERAALISQCAADGPNQTMHYPRMLGRGFGIPSSLTHEFSNGRFIGETVDIISGVRDPVKRAISAVAFLLNGVGYTRCALTVRDGATVKNFNDFFHRVVEMAINGDDPNDDTCVRFLIKLLTDYQNWFERELLDGFGLDITRAEYNPVARCLYLGDGGKRLVVYRVEDLVDRKAHETLIASTNNYLDCSLASIPAEDKSREQRFHAFYRECVKSIGLSPEKLDWFYNCDTVRKFYSSEEVEIMRSRWA